MAKEKGKKVVETTKDKEKEVKGSSTDYELLVSGIAEKTGVAKSTIKDVITAIPEVIKEAVAERGSIKVKGLMSVKLVMRAERTGFNIIKGEKMTIPAQCGINLSASGTLKDFAKEFSTKEYTKKFGK